MKVWRKKNYEKAKMIASNWKKSNPQKVRDYDKKWHNENNERRKDYPSAKRWKQYQLKHLYGLSLEDFKKILEKQSGVCAVCESSLIEGSICVDHNHKTQKIRGLLCGNCNVGIGHFKENEKYLYSAIKYIQFHKS